MCGLNHSVLIRSLHQDRVCLQPHHTFNSRLLVSISSPVDMSSVMASVVTSDKRFGSTSYFAPSCLSLFLSLSFYLSIQIVLIRRLFVSPTRKLFRIICVKPYPSPTQFFSLSRFNPMTFSFINFILNILEDLVRVV